MDHPVPPPALPPRPPGGVGDDQAPGRPLCLFRATLGTLLFFFVQALVALPVVVAWRVATGGNPASDNVPYLAAVEVGLAAVALALVARLRPDGIGLRGWLAAPPGAWVPLLPVVGIGVGIPVAAAIATGTNTLADNLSPSRVVALVVLAWSVAVAEEMTFRVLVLWGAGSWHYPLYATIVTSVLFGAGHVALGGSGLAVASNAVSVALVVGIPLAAIRLRTGTVLWAIVAHGAFDTYGLLTLGNLQLPSHVSVGEVVWQVGSSAVVGAGYLVWLRSSPGRPVRA